MATPQLNQLSKKIYEANKEKGFWSGERSSAEILVLIQSELYEALEAHRKNRYATKVQDCLALLNQENFSDFFLQHIKDSFEDELADTVIRILDMAGAWDFEIQNMYLAPSLIAWSSQNKSLQLMQRERYSFQSCVLEFGYLVNDTIQQELQTTVSEKVLEQGANQMLRFILGIAKHFRVKIWDYVKLKLAYNTTRAFKHGKLY